MAEFNPKVSERGESDYLGKSKGVEAPRANATLGKLFGDIAETGDSVVKVADQGIKRDINDQVTAGVDKIRGEVGVDTATDMAGQGNTLLPNQGGAPVPTAITKAGGDVARLKEAYDQGKINDSYYWGRVNALAKTVRTQYPSYRDEIDSTFSGVTGANPANALRKAIQSEFNEAQGKLESASSKQDQFENSNLQEIVRSMPDYFQRKAAGNPYDFTTTKANVAKIQVKSAVMKDQMSAMELADKQGKLDSETVQTTMVNQANSLINETISSSVQTLGTRMQEAIKSGKPIPPEQIQEFKAAYGQLRAKAEVSINQLLNTPFGDDKTRTPAAVLKDASKVKFIKDNALANLDSMQELLTNGQYGLFQQNASIAKATQDATYATVLQTIPSARILQSAQQLAGPAINAMVATGKGKQLLDDFSEAMSNVNVSESVIGEGSITKQLDRLGDPKRATPGQPPVLGRGAAARLIDDKVAILSSDQAPVTAKVNTAKSMFGTDEGNFLSKFKPADQLRVYQRMTSPEVTKQMVALRGTDPTTFEAYKTWATKSFSTVFKSAADTVSDLNTYSSDLKLTYDPVNMQYQVAIPEVQGGAATPLGVAGGAASVLARNLRMNQATAAIEPINTALRNLKPIVNETGKDNEALIKTLTGINPDSPKQRGLLQWLGEGALNVVSGAASAVGNAVVSPAKGATPKDFSLATYTPEEVSGGLSDDAIQTADLSGISFDGETVKGMTATGGVKGLLDKIGQGEAAGSYNKLFGGREAPLTDMTLGQVMSFQNQMKQKGSPSTAVGKYQFINSTLGNIARKMGIGPDEKFTPEIQDKLALGLLKGRGLDEFMAGRMSKAAFIDSVSKEWAIVKGSSGRGAYDGDGLNRAALNISDLVDSLKS
jgi:hypothetical protein